MQSRFGLKDFVLLVAVILVGAVTFMAMRQDDRRWRLTQEANARLADQADALRQMRSTLQESGGGGTPTGALAQIAQGQAQQTEAISALVGELSKTNAQLEALMLATSKGGDEMRAELERIQKEAANRQAQMQARLDEMRATAAASPGAPTPGIRDESWGREGIPITWSEPLALAEPPFDKEGYAEGGTFVEVFEGQPPIITPYRIADVYGRRLTDQVCETLGYYEPASLRLVGKLADAWQYDPEGIWLRVHINPRARFSDGQPVTAEDVRYSFHDFMFNPEIEADRYRGTYNGIAKVEVVSDGVVEFTFKEKRFDNISQAFGFLILPRHFYSQFTARQINEGTGLLMGSGPYRLERLDPNDQWAPPRDIVLVRNENYWGPRPSLDRLRFRTIQDSLARLTDYANGKSDMIRPTSDQFRAKVDEPGFTDTTYPLNWFNMQSGYAFIAWQCGPRNGRLLPFHDKKVRMAMTHLIDRERVLRDIYKRLGSVATSPFNPATEQADPTIEPWPYDVERAKELLAEAGWEDRDGDGILENGPGERFEFEFVFGTGSESTERMVTYIKDQCATVGIKCTPRPTDWSIFQTLLSNRDFDAITFAWSASAPENDPNQIWHSSQIENQGDNFIQWNSPEADALIEEGRRQTNDAERMKVWHKLHRVFHEEQPYTFMINIPWLRFVNKRVENVNTYPSGLEQREMFIRVGNQGILN